MALRIILFAQNKLKMRERLGSLGLPMPDWAEIHDADALDSFIEAHGGVAILKTPIGGYDGKGVWVVPDRAGAVDVMAQISSSGTLRRRSLLAPSSSSSARSASIFLAAKA